MYLSSLFGGASAQLIDAIEQRGADNPQAFGSAAITAEILQDHINGVPGPIDPQVFSRVRIHGLSELNLLESSENRRMFANRDLSEVIGLTLTGLGRLSRQRR